MYVKIDGIDFVVRKGTARTIEPRNRFIDDIVQPPAIIRECKKNKIPADLLYFSQILPDRTPKFNYYMEWDNVAAVEISSYEHWLMKQIHPNTRNKINKGKKKGVEVKVEKFSRRIAEGLVEIFNETPVRRGKKYSYYGRDLRTVEQEWSRDAHRNDFLVAYYEDEIIGFIQLVYGGTCARTSGTVAKLSHHDKSPMNALFAKAVETCAEKKIPYLLYGKFSYVEDEKDSLTIFKENNGFKKFDLPQYYVPITLRGRLMLLLNMHHGLQSLLPDKVLFMVKKFRTAWYKNTKLRGI